MIFVDASAIVAIIAQEPEATDLADRLELEAARATSGLAVFEATLALARKGGIAPGAAEKLVLRFLEKTSIEVRPIGEETAILAIDAHTRYGTARHPTGLNMGDCFAYACAKLSGATLLYEGADFDATDLRAGP
jgi:ribonuclease VapC